MTFSEDRYKDLIQDIFKRFPSVQKTDFAHAYKPGLDRMIAFDKILGSPSQKLRCIHVAGTNGKGSVANMIAAVLTNCGLKTGLYTSPHILDMRERMRIGSELIPKEYVYDFLCRWEKTFDEYELSFFEITTCLAFKWFEDENVDVAVIEVGLGGRLDSTNIIHPDLSIITSIGKDHCAYLGNTLEEIAAEKAGIMKKDVPTIIGETLPETEPVFLEKAKGPIIFAEKVNPTLWDRKDEILSNMDLRGKYQEKNLRTVLCAIDILRDIPFYQCLDNQEDIVYALENTASIMDFHGRWERISKNPDIICDIGHNAPALKYNFSQLKEYIDKGVYSSLIIIYGIMADKDLDAILPLMPQNAIWILTTAGTSRSLPSKELKKKFDLYFGEDFISYKTDSVAEAIELAHSLIINELPHTGYGDNPLIYIGGSTFVVSEAVQYISEHQ